MEISFYDLAGWIGMVLLILAYSMISFKKIKSKSKPFHFINLLGAIGILINAIYNKLFPVIILNIFWIVISVISLVNIFKIKPVYKELN